MSSRWPDWGGYGLQVPLPAIVGKLSLAKLFNTRFLPASPYGCPSHSSPASSPAQPSALHLKCHLPDTEGSCGRAQVMGVSRQLAGKGSFLPISQSCTIGKKQKEMQIS